MSHKQLLQLAKLFIWSRSRAAQAEKAFKYLNTRAPRGLETALATRALATPAASTTFENGSSAAGDDESTP